MHGDVGAFVIVAILMLLLEYGPILAAVVGCARLGVELRRGPDWGRVVSAVVKWFVVPWVLVGFADLIVGQVLSESGVKQAFFVCLGLAGVAGIVIAARVVADRQKATTPRKRDGGASGPPAGGPSDDRDAGR